MSEHDLVEKITDFALKEIRDETFRRVGRNVVLFQQLEGVLKFLAAIQHPSTPLSKAAAARDMRANLVRKQTLGQIAGEVSKALFEDCASHSSAPDEISETWLGFSFRIGADPQSIDEGRATLKGLIEERNDLVHHLLARWKMEDANSCRALSAELDAQRERIVREIERYRSYANAIREMARDLQAFIASERGEGVFELAFLQQSYLASLLISAATENARPDGWTLLSTAGHRLKELIPDEFARLKALHGEGSLQKLVAAIGLFDIASETLPTGGTRVLYRMRIPNEIAHHGAEDG